ncbi:Rossmann-like and DUF2520 domain-containing protein [Pedobacter steynii]|uniref:Oxidoreductase n=1 Tax=Pedobacter steynii TaxID=430522 RepID=A0A1D7QI27_9SPHI|nr:DUF2520 domain-containing protein [Pedobacter steynii]AOM78322.1 oxidoreductase [Pedobacter steynii]
MKIVCIGSGNVATHFSNAFKSAGSELVQIWSKNPEHAAELAIKTGAKPIADLKEIDNNADVYLIAVKDDAIEEVIAQLSAVKGMIVHTSGATDIDVFPATIAKYGVLYPLQTFSKHKAIDFNQVPLCIEAKDEEILKSLKSIALMLSPLVYEVNSEKRRILHLSAVFACNFVNHLYTLSNEILQRNELDFEILRPLIMETAEKVQNAFPVDVQTGPAIRNDEQTITKHKELLSNMPELKDIYETLSKSIKKTH